MTDTKTKEIAYIACNPQVSPIFMTWPNIASANDPQLQSGQIKLLTEAYNKTFSTVSGIYTLMERDGVRYAKPHTGAKAISDKALLPPTGDNIADTEVKEIAYIACNPEQSPIFMTWPNIASANDHHIQNGQLRLLTDAYNKTFDAMPGIYTLMERNGVRYVQPPVGTKTFLEAMKDWKKVAACTGYPVARHPDNGNCIVVGPDTTPADFNRVLKANNAEAFMEALKSVSDAMARGPKKETRTPT